MTQDPELFNYPLPVGAIAQEPLEDRASSRLLVARAPEWAAEHRAFRELANLIPTRSILIRNETRVIPARVFMQRTTGGKIEVFCLESRTAQLGSEEWSVMTRGKAPVGAILTSPSDPEIRCEILGRSDDATALARWTYPARFANFSDVLQAIGHVPLPPYMTREDRAEDRGRYQTVFAQTDGSVAAPTAGLHFDKAVLTQVEQAGSKFLSVCLHVGLGTFQPMKSPDLRAHSMHEERWSVPLSTLGQLIQHLQDPERGLTLAIGTTSLRTIESLAWSAVLGQESQFISQWTAFESPKPTTQVLINALIALAERTRQRGLTEISGSTRLMIGPGAHILLVEAMVTNFHQPMSTLLALIANFVGPQWRSLYETALTEKYRFLSYGDACLFFRTNKSVE